MNGITPEYLLEELNSRLDFTCSRYDLLFIKTYNGWSLDKNENKQVTQSGKQIKKKYNDYSSNRKYKSFPKNVNIKVNSKTELVLAAGIVTFVGVAVDKTLETCLHSYNYSYYTTRKYLGYNDIETELKLTKTQETIKSIGAAVITTGVAISVAIVLTEDHKTKSKNKKLYKKN